MDPNYKHSDITSLVLKAFFNVYNELGYGFLEKVYENALLIELKRQGLKAEKQQQIEVFYHEEKVGTYYADIIVNNIVILELKAVEKIALEHEVQLVNYLKATEIEVGLLLNFGPKPQYLRRVFSHNHSR